jgi:two-component system nitrate/nitrite response regulator NarL
MSEDQSRATKPLSVREKQVLGLILCGHPNKTIARELAISEQTVKVYVRSIMRKIGARNRTEAAMWAVSKG